MPIKFTDLNPGEDGVTRLSLGNLGVNFTVRSVITPDDFAMNLVFDDKLAVKMTLEQWEHFVKEIMAIWSRRG